MKIASKEQSIRNIYIRYKTRELKEGEAAYQINAILSVPYEEQDEGIEPEQEVLRLQSLRVEGIIRADTFRSQLQLLGIDEKTVGQMLACPICHASVAIKARRCWNCGTKIKKKSVWGTVIMTIVILAALPIALLLCIHIVDLLGF